MRFSLEPAACFHSGSRIGCSLEMTAAKLAVADAAEWPEYFFCRLTHLESESYGVNLRLGM